MLTEEQFLTEAKTIGDMHRGGITKTVSYLMDSHLTDTVSTRPMIDADWIPKVTITLSGSIQRNLWSVTAAGITGMGCSAREALQGWAVKISALTSRVGSGKLESR